MRIGITGAFGQFGWHLRCYLFAQKEIEVACAGRDEFTDPQKLTKFVSGVDAIIHLAGVNRAEEAEVERANPALAEQLVSALKLASVTPHLLFSSTTHINNDNTYGQSKRKAGEVLARWANHADAKVSKFVFPHLFGEYGRPNYNSAVSTFCWQVANGEEPGVTGNGRVELLHFNDASKLLFEAIENGRNGDERPKGTDISVREVADRIKSLADSYQNQIIPDLRDPLDLRLFNIYRGYLFPQHYPVSLKTNTDDRGSLTESVKSHNGGQTFFSTTKPGITRGNHFHYHKVERFLVVKGKAQISLRKMLTDERHEFVVSGDQLEYVDMPTHYTHNITNIGDEELVTLFWSHELFDPENPDTIFEIV